MKRFHIIALGALALFGMASCEMKDELWGSSSNSNEDGGLELSVTAKQPVSMTRADAVTVNTDNYPVSIAHKTDADVKKEFEKVSEMPSYVALPVGEYTVSSHTPGEVTKQMSAAYYAGSTDMTISKGITTQTTVVCKMKNSRIKVVYGTDFLAAFESWTMTVDDGTNSAISYTEANTSPADVYYLFEENTVEKINVNISAKTKAGNTVSEKRTFKKANATEGYEEESKYFGGGDAIQINMGAVENANGIVDDITINTFITFENESSSVEIPVVIASLTMPSNASYTIDDNNASTDMPTEADALVETPAGLQSLVVTIESGNEAFTAALNTLKTKTGLDFINGVDIVDNTAFETLIQATDATLKAPAGSQVANYTFPIAKFLTKLNAFGATDSGKAHKFTATVTDNEGSTASGTYTVTITKPVVEEPEITTPSMELPDDLTISLSEGTEGITAVAKIKAPATLNSMTVKIVAGCDAFVEALNMTKNMTLDFIEGVDMVAQGAYVNALFSSIGKSEVVAPTTDTTEYEFSIHSFFTFITDPTDEGKAHEFQITVIDDNGESVSGTFKLTVKE
ncbi:MAG: DUF4493 domain-containing protein [Bacteroides sp.]|nr:DUF4493 domain-containing protein [Bacteroides sp.]